LKGRKKEKAPLHWGLGGVHFLLGMGMDSRREDARKHCEQVRNVSKVARDTAAAAVAHATEIRARIKELLSSAIAKQPGAPPR
jgi:hypothetical protein